MKRQYRAVGLAFDGIQHLLFGAFGVGQQAFLFHAGIPTGRDL